MKQLFRELSWTNLSKGDCTLANELKKESLIHRVCCSVNVRDPNEP